MTRAMVSRLVDIMRRCDPEYCASHSVAQTTDDEFDEALADAEELLDEPDPTRELLLQGVGFVEEETRTLEECHLDPKTGEMDDEDVAAQIVVQRDWVDKARKATA